MSDFQSPGSPRGPFVNQEDLDDAGHPLPEGMELPTVQEHEYTVDDEDSQQCYFIGERELAPIYVDNAVEVSPVQPDVWTLDTDNEYVTFTYNDGSTAVMRLGDIQLSGGDNPDRLVKYNGVVYPMEGSNAAYNPHTTPRLAELREWVLDQTRQASDVRVEMAELANAFAQQIKRLSSGANAVGRIQKGLPFDKYQLRK